MALDAWLPIGYKLPDDAKTHVTLFEGVNWQIVETQGNGRAIITHDDLVNSWVKAGLITSGVMSAFNFGEQRLWSISCSPSQIICPVSSGKSPDSKVEALAFAQALKATRNIDRKSPLQDAIYVEKISRLLPTYSISSKTGDDIVFGYWLTGGASISVKSFRRLRQNLSWLRTSHLKEIVEAAGFDVTEVILADKQEMESISTNAATQEKTQMHGELIEMTQFPQVFELPGRPELASFINEHIIDIIRDRLRYKALGVEFPSAIILQGPPGCGKTFAVERLVDFLGWPSFQIDASSVASPYIHETSKKVAMVFDEAIKNAPSVLIIDEMEAFLSTREMNSGHHHVEEIAEFLRRIPEATKNDVLIVAMTNRIEMIDPAILRRGRFDHVIEVDYASEAEVLSLLDKLLASLPKEEDIDAAQFAKQLANRPLSDVAFVVREGARLAVRSGNNKLNHENLLAALHSTPVRERKNGSQRRIGFI